MKIGDITDDGWEVASIDIIYRKRVITIKDYISPTIGFKKGVEGWLSLSDLNDINSGVVILDNNKYSRLIFNPTYYLHNEQLKYNHSNFQPHGVQAPASCGNAATRPPRGYYRSSRRRKPAPMSHISSRA